MEGKSRRVKKIREILPFDDEGSDDPDPSSPSRRPPAAVGGRAAQAGGLPPPPSFGPPPSGPPKLPTRAKAAFQEAGPPPSRAPRRGRPRPRGGGKRVRTRALAKTATGLESDDSSEEEAPASRSTGSKQAPPQASQAEEEAPGFFQSLWNGAAAAIGVVSDIVTAINAETDSEDEKQQASSKESKEGKSSEAEAKDKEKSSKTSAEEEEQYVEYVSQFCVYLGVDATAEPDLITEVDDYLRRPLPAGWTSHQTGEDCEYGSGYTYFMQAATGRTQWTRPDEDEFLQYLRKKMRRKPAAGSRLFFAALRDRNRRERWAALEDQIDHLSGARPLLRALPEGSPEPAPPNRSENLEDPCIFHVVLHKRFPVMAPAVVEAFASYFGLGALTQLTAAELRHVWVAKVAALCPVPTGWEFKFDETSLTAVFVDQAANVASRHHPMDAFFAGLLERLLSRHRSVEAAESQRSAEPVALGSQMVFYLDSRNGAPYWLQYGTGKPWQGTLPWKHKKSHQAPPPKPRPLSAKLQPPTPDAGSRAGGGVGLRDAANVPGRFDLSLRAAATQGPGGAPPQPVPKTPQPPPTPPSLTPKQDDTDVDAVGVASAEASEDGSEAADDASCTVESAEVKEDAARRPSSHEVPASRTSEASEDGEVLPSEPQVEPVAAAVDERAEGPGDVPDPSTPSGGPPLADEGAVATATETEPVADPPETTDVSQEQEGSPEQLRPAEELEPQETQVPRGPQKPQEPLEAESTAIEETAPPPPETAEPPEPPGPAPAPPPEETTEEAEGTESSKAQELPFLPSDAAEAGKKALAPHWSQRGGKWQTRGSRLSSDEEGELDDDEEAQRRKIERAQRAAERRAKSGKLKDAVARFQSDEESQGPAGPRLSPRSATLFRLAGELQTAPASDAPTLLGILQELERLPATVDLLRQTQLGVITQPFKDHGDPEVRALAKRLRRTWKDLIATAAGEAAAAMPPALPPPETEAASAASAVLSREPHHGMAPLMPGLEQEAEELLQELEEATSPERRPDPGVRTAKVGGTDDADEVFGPTPRHEPNDHVGSPHRRPRPKAAPKASAVADADEVFGTTPRQGASGYHAEQPPSASVPSEAKKPKFAALPKMPVQAKASVQPAQGEVPDPSSVPAPTPVSVDEASATPLPDISEDSSQAQERQGAPAALKSALPRAPVPTEPATASEPSAETAGYQEVAREAPAALKAPLPKAPLPKAPLPKAPLPEVQQSEAPAPPTPHDTPQAAAPAPPTPHDTAWAAAPAPPTPHDTARAAAPAPPTPHDTARAAAPAPPTPHDTTEELFEAPAADSHKKEQRATAPVPDTTPTMPVPAAATATPAAPTPAMPEAQKPAPSEKPKFAPLPAVPKLPPKPAPQPPKPAVPEASEQSSEDELIPATPQGPPEEVAAPQPPLPKGPMPSAGYPKKAAPPQAPGPRVNAGLPAAARRQRMELVSNLQWLCRLFLETREQLFAAHEGTETEANCEGLREELDAVLFRRLLEETLTLPETAASPKSLIRLLRSFGRRALYGRRRSVYGRRAHLHFQQACAAKGGPRAFVLGAVPKILQLMSRLVDEGHASMDDAVEDGGDDPWLGSGTAGDDRAATSPKAHGGLPDWETLEGILSEPKDLQSLQDEADAFLAEAAKPLPAPLRLTEADRAPLSAEAPNSGSFAPRGRRAAPGAGKASADGAANSRRIPAQKPFYSTEPSLLLKVAKAPLPNLDQLVACLVPGAEITTEGLLLQLADDDLVIVAYALQQIEEAASKRLIKELEVRDELRSTCMHRREYLQLLEGALTQGQA